MTVDQLIERLEYFNGDALILIGAEGMTVSRWIKMLKKYRGDRNVNTNMGLEDDVETFPVTLVEAWEPRCGGEASPLLYGNKDRRV